MAKQIQKKGLTKELKTLTVEELKKYPGCENLSDEKAKEIINSMVELSFIIINKRLEKYE
jgi:hypothetical protein